MKNENQRAIGNHDSGGKDNFAHRESRITKFNFLGGSMKFKNQAKGDHRMKNSRAFFPKAIFMAFCLLLSSINLTAQAPIGKIVGTVTENEGLGLPGVSVKGKSAGLVGQVTATTDGNGNFRLFGLSPGTYELTFTFPGFKTVIQKDIVVKIEDTLTVNVEMEPGMEEEVSVVAQAPLIDVKSTAKGMTLTKEDFEALPKGRNFDSLVSVIAGAAQEDNAGGSSVDGATGLENMYYIDGMDISDSYLGNLKQQAAFEFVEEVQVKSSGYQAEFGGSLGGVINVMTRSGGNSFHGEVVGYLSGSALTGRERNTLRLDPFNVTKAEYVNYQDMYGKDNVRNLEIGLSLSGYAIKDRVWFFMSFLPRFQETTRDVMWLKGAITSSSHNQKYRWANFMGKISSQPFKNLRLTASVINNSSTYVGGLPRRDGSDDSSYPYSQVGFGFPNFTVAGSADLTLGSNFFLNIRGGYFMSDQSNQKLRPSGPRYSFAGVGTMGWGGVPQTNSIYPELVAMYPEYIRAANFQNYGANDAFVTNKMFLSRTSANADLTYYFSLWGEHALKTGFQLVRLVDDIDNTYAYENFLFGWGQDYVIPGSENVRYKGKYGVYAVNLTHDWGDYGKAISNRLAFYLQDSWTIAKKITVNYGVRAEKENVPSYSSDPRLKGAALKWGFSDKFAPRFGFILDIFGDSSLKIFSNYSIYYDVLKLSLARNTFGAIKRVYTFYTLDDPKWWTYGNGNIPGKYINNIVGWGDALLNYSNTDKNMKAMAQREIAIGAEKRLRKDVSLSVRFVRKSLLRAIEDIGLMSASGTVWYYGNPGFGLIRPISEGGIFLDKYPPIPKAKREYAAINLVLEKRQSGNWQGGFSYTWSRLWGNFSGLANTQSGQLQPNLTGQFDGWYTERDKNMNPLDGPLGSDRIHSFKFYGSYVFDFGLTVGFISSARSGTPVSRRISVPRPLYVNGLCSDGRTPFLWTTNVYVEHRIRLNKYSLNVNLNIDNIFNIRTAQAKWPNVIQGSIQVKDDDLVSNTWDLSKYKHTLDPRFLMEYNFYPPISVRVGFNFSF